MMLGLIRKSEVKAFVADALAEALKTRKDRYELDNLELRGQIGALRDALDTARADAAELKTEITREIEQRIEAERQAHEEAARVVLGSVSHLSGRLDVLSQSMPESVDLWPLSREVAELTDTVAYLLESPATVIERHAVSGGGTMAAFGWVKPMGS
jgi:hypothetical protein